MLTAMAIILLLILFWRIWLGLVLLLAPLALGAVAGLFALAFTQSPLLVLGATLLTIWAGYHIVTALADAIDNP